MFDFIVRRFIGLSGIRLVTSLIVSVVNGQELAMLPPQAAGSDSSGRLPP